MEISDLIKSARIEKGLTQQQLADVVFVTRQTISKWELGKSVPDQASLILLYQYLDIKDNEKKQLSKLIFNKQNIILILIAILFSPMVIGVRFICCKIDKIENRKIKAVIKVIGFVVFSSYLLLGWTFDIMDISKNSLLPVMSADDKERNSLSLFNALGTMIGGAVLAVAAPILVAEGTLQNYYVLIFGSMAMVLVLSIAGALCVKERVAFEGKKEESYTFRELLQFMRYKPVWAMFVMALVAGVGSNIAGGAGAYFYTYIMGDMTLMSGVSLVSMITALVGIFLGPILANRFGKKKIYVMAIVVSILFTALRLIDVRSMLLIYISTVAGGVAGGCIAPLTTSIQADNTTYVQYKTGKRAEAAIASFTSFITKVAQGIGGAIPGYVLAATGFVTGSAVQPESINTGIILCVLILPIILTSAGAILFGTQYTLDKKAVEEMNTAIAARSNK